MLKLRWPDKIHRTQPETRTALSYLTATMWGRLATCRPIANRPVPSEEVTSSLDKRVAKKANGDRISVAGMTGRNHRAIPAEFEKHLDATVINKAISGIIQARIIAPCVVTNSGKKSHFLLTDWATQSYSVL